MEDLKSLEKYSIDDRKRMEISVSVSCQRELGIV
jgi:hypothetical protein